MTKFSIIIPAYNEEKYISKALTAISEMTLQPDEVIVVDNNSTDKTSCCCLS
jgi:glycosyltransferase involved in cell wall biosynthesis